MNDDFTNQYWHSDNPPEIQLPSPSLILPGDKPYFCDEMALARLLIDEAIFCNSRDYLFDGKKSGHSTLLFVVCNDIFSWGCADAEDLPLDKIEELYNMHMADRKWGAAKWCCKQRKEKPQNPVAEAMKKDGSWEPWMDELAPNYYSTKLKEDYEQRQRNNTQTQRQTAQD